MKTYWKGSQFATVFVKQKLPRKARGNLQEEGGRLIDILLSTWRRKNSSSPWRGGHAGGVLRPVKGPLST